MSDIPICGLCDVVENREKYGIRSGAIFTYTDNIYFKDDGHVSSNRCLVEIKPMEKKMSNEKNCWCLYCTAGYTFSCVAETADILREFEKENKALKAEVETLKKDNEELSDIYCQRNLILSEENQKLNREIERLTDWNIS